MWALGGSSPFLLRCLRPLSLGCAWHCSQFLRRNLLSNARYLLPETATHRDRTRFARAVIRRHYELLVDFMRMRDWSLEQYQSLVDETGGLDNYERARKGGRGTILVTAHIGSFEVALAALRRIETKVHVVFTRNEHAAFEGYRSRQRERLGVTEAPTNDGMTMWLGLREALADDAVVVIQGDRVMPGQKGVRVPFCGGSLELPTGPVKLAMATGATLVPVFAIYTQSPRLRLQIDPAIDVPDATEQGSLKKAISEIAKRIERVVREQPDQWLAAHSALIGPMVDEGAVS
jgi:KDO2-lipid IV(A) lauroyltransferase